jgi:ring-1,2-phenylacetyl-CoA epoxidase subunit PaaE
MQFHNIKVKDIRKETADCVSVSFDIPADLTEQFLFKAGQYITIKKTLETESIRRSYSICSSPVENELRIAVKKVPNGIFSSFVNDALQVGDLLELMPPLGKFHVEPNVVNHHHYAAFAAGSGITPILSIIKSILLNEPKSSFTLVYGNRNRHSIIFKEALESLKNQFMDRFRIIHILSREKTDAGINFGRIDAIKCADLFDKIISLNSIDSYYLCGPEEMVFSIKTYLENQAIDPKKIHFELFTTAKRSNNSSTSKEKEVASGVTSNISITLDGISFDFKLAAQGKSILEAALQLGADLPFACKSGVCCTCKAKLLEGEVEMDVVYGLEPDEIDRGYILTCQSHPRSATVVVDFDSK